MSAALGLMPFAKSHSEPPASSTAGYHKPGRLSKRKGIPHKSPPPDPHQPRNGSNVINLAQWIAQAKHFPSLVNDRALGSASLPPISRNAKPKEPVTPVVELIKHTVATAAPVTYREPVPLPPFAMVTRRSASAAAAAAARAQSVEAGDPAASAAAHHKVNVKSGKSRFNPAVELVAAESAAMRHTQSAPSHQDRLSVSPPSEIIDDKNSNGDTRRRGSNNSANSSNDEARQHNQPQEVSIVRRRGRPKRVAASQNVNPSVSEDEDLGENGASPNKRRKISVAISGDDHSKRGASIDPISPPGKAANPDPEKLNVATLNKRATRMASPLRFSNESEDEGSVDGALSEGRRAARHREGPSHLKLVFALFALKY